MTSDCTIPHTLRVCTKCGEEKPLEDYPLNAMYAQSRSRACKACRNAAERVRRACRASGAYEALHAAQGGLCDCCGAADELHVDHDHRTGEVRGLLCLGCNVGIGQLKDNPSILVNAIHYLSRHGRVLSTYEVVELLHVSQHLRGAA